MGDALGDAHRTAAFEFGDRNNNDDDGRGCAVTTDRDVLDLDAPEHAVCSDVIHAQAWKIRSLQGEIDAAKTQLAAANDRLARTAWPIGSKRAVKTALDVAIAALEGRPFSPALHARPKAAAQLRRARAALVAARLIWA